MIENKTIIGNVIKRNNSYFIVDEQEGKEYKLYAIKPMEAVSPDFNTGKFDAFIGKKVEASGLFEYTTIWNAYLSEIK